MSDNKGFESSSSYVNSSSDYSANAPPPTPGHQNEPIMLQPMGQSRSVSQQVQYGQSINYTQQQQTTQFHYEQQRVQHHHHQQHEQVTRFQYNTPGSGPMTLTNPTFIQPQVVIPLNVPHGLDSLLNLDRLFVKQKVELLEAFLGCETKNKYKILTPTGQQLFSAKEDTDCCTRNCLGAIRPFDIKIKDGNDQEIIRLSRGLACGSCCFPCCLQSIDVESPPGNLIGRIEQDWTLIIPKFRVLDAQGDVVLRIKGPFCTISCCGSVDFQVLSPNGDVEVGKISKQWSGLAKEYFTDADNFGLSFPMDLDVKMKAVMLGACLLIDFMYFEHKDNNN